MIMHYPKLEAVETADIRLLKLWYDELPAPGENFKEFPEKEFKKKLREEARILTRITERLVELSKAQKKASLLERAKELGIESIDLDELR